MLGLSQAFIIGNPPQRFGKTLNTYLDVWNKFFKVNQENTKKTDKPSISSEQRYRTFFFDSHLLSRFSSVIIVTVLSGFCKRCDDRYVLLDSEAYLEPSRTSAMEALLRE